MQQKPIKITTLLDTYKQTFAPAQKRKQKLSDCLMILETLGFDTEQRTSVSEDTSSVKINLGLKELTVLLKKENQQEFIKILLRSTITSINMYDEENFTLNNKQNTQEAISLFGDDDLEIISLGFFY